MKDYKDTLNLPKTELAMKANLPNKEPELLKYWEEICYIQDMDGYTILMQELNQIQDPGWKRHIIIYIKDNYENK